MSLCTEVSNESPSRRARTLTPWSAMVPLRMTGRRAAPCGWRRPRRSGITPIPEVLMKILSAVPFGTTLVSPVTTDTPAARRPLAHGGDDRLQLLDRKALLDDQRDAQVQRAGPAHGQIVHGAVNGQLADVAAREENRVHGVRVRRERHPLAASTRKWRRRSAGPGSGLLNTGSSMSRVMRCEILPPLPWSRRILSVFISVHPVFLNAGVLFRIWRCRSRVQRSGFRRAKQGLGFFCALPEL